jgi:hypothetical protein
MSQRDTRDPIPTVILVTTPPNPVRKRRSSAAEFDLPWLKIAIGGTIAFMLVIVGLGVVVMRPGRDAQVIDMGGIPPAPRVKPVPAEPLAALPKVAPREEVPAEAMEAIPLFAEDIVNCKQIGTDVRFFKDATEAFKRAKVEKKLVYMMHLSGNLDDPDFT